MIQIVTNCGGSKICNLAFGFGFGLVYFDLVNELTSIIKWKIDTKTTTIDYDLNILIEMEITWKTWLKIDIVNEI